MRNEDLFRKVRGFSGPCAKAADPACGCPRHPLLLPLMRHFRQKGDIMVAKRPPSGVARLLSMSARQAVSVPTHQDEAQAES
jgi:hypothetical protein